ncbi:GroES-like protein [Hypoxylon rubiginosum]|uniref:GroES-like protein n=1 Tax=Hypoxylon rubiginosum TaxID=110542 RepID=A0ACB9YLM4_9PEZI|nr:GroES-like protein [Hypoxylon rubiginosum]
MRALRYYGPHDLRLEHDVPEPKCLPHQVKVRPSFCGICGSDLHAYLLPTVIPFKDTPHPVTGETWPVTFGHEFSGDVVEVGSEVQGELRVGDRVAVQPTICCNRCPPCKEGYTNCCNSLGFVGLTGWGGGMSDFVSVDAKFAFKLPDNVPSDIGAMVEPLAVAWHAVDQTGIKPGGSALVMGAGPVGLAIIQCLKARQAKEIIVVEIVPERKKFATRFGATAVIDPQEQDVVAKCKELCDGQGPETAFDCAGAAASIKSACLAIRYRGLVVNVAFWEKEVPFQFNNLMFGEKRFCTSISYSAADFRNVVEALGNGLLDVREMITRKTTMDRVVEDGFYALMHEKDKHMKILIEM